MSVFEDLIDELKSENLLESTVVDVKRTAVEAGLTRGTVLVPAATNAGSPPQAIADTSTATSTDPEPSAAIHGRDETEFFLNRAAEEVSSLQMVEHVLSGVERTLAIDVPAGFDDLNVKKALHRLQQVSGDANSPEHVEAEFGLRQETHAWAFALHQRDQIVPLADLRRFCEDSRPVLSSQALVALAGFYRNSPFSEDVRAKFDFVMTRLFARDSGEGFRKPLFTEKETIAHINTLYGKWSSVAMYSAVENNDHVASAVRTLERFRTEADEAGCFDDLLRCDLLARVLSYKEELAEVFFVPEVVGASITCNLALGNRFVELVTAEKAKGNSTDLEAKYGDAYDEMAAGATARTLRMCDVLSMDPEAESGVGDSTVSNEPMPTAQRPSDQKPVKVPIRPAMELFGVNRWLLALCVACILVGVGVYVWAENFATGGDVVETVSTPVKIGDEDLNKFIGSARTTKDTLYALTGPAFEALSDEKKREVLARAQRFASSVNCSKVNLIDPSGRSVAFASKDRFELIER